MLLKKIENPIRKHVRRNPRGRGRRQHNPGSVLGSLVLLGVVGTVGWVASCSHAAQWGLCVRPSKGLGSWERVRLDVKGTGSADLGCDVVHRWACRFYWCCAAYSGVGHGSHSDSPPPKESRDSGGSPTSQVCGREKKQRRQQVRRAGQVPRRTRSDGVRERLGKQRRPDQSGKRRQRGICALKLALLGSRHDAAHRSERGWHC